jgi:hypothetical protein
MLRGIGRATDVCLCGKRFVTLESAHGHGHREVLCSCRRRAACASEGGGWVVQAVLTPEGSVPLQGFSRELRAEPDVERFWFLHSIGGATLPVHVVFSPALHVAEVKAADMKALRLDGVASPSEARRMWIEQREPSRAEKRPSLRSLRRERPSEI